MKPLKPPCFACVNVPSQRRTASGHPPPSRGRVVGRAVRTSARRAERGCLGAGSAGAGPGTPGLGRAAAAGRGPLPTEPRLGHVFRLILLIKFFPNWTILGFLPWWTCVSDLNFHVGLEERFSLLLKPFPPDSE